MLKRKAEFLGDSLVAALVQREAGTVLTIYQAEIIDSESGVVIPAKSIEVAGVGIENLKELINKF